jgi:hypothetical protein
MPPPLLSPKGLNIGAAQFARRPANDGEKTPPIEGEPQQFLLSQPGAVAASGNNGWPTLSFDGTA